MNIVDLVAPPLQVSQWLNTGEPINLAGLRGRVVVLHAFQMLCPGCVSHGIPQAMRIHELFPASELAVIGLHSVFEHHAVMGQQALQVFMHEYRIPFPVGIDRPAADGQVPLTMRAYALRGTPSVVLLDRQGRVRLNHFGRIDDLQLGAVIGQLCAQSAALPAKRPPAADAAASAASACADGVCALADPP